MWPRSLRGRLVAIYTVVAVLLGGVGIVAFQVLLDRAVAGSEAATLEARVAAVALQLRSTGALPAGWADSPTAGPPGGDTGAQQGPGAHGGLSGIDSFVAVYRPDGRLAGAQPALGPPALVSGDLVRRARHDQRFSTVGTGDGRLRVLAAPVAGPGGTWVVVVGASAADFAGTAGRATEVLRIVVSVLIVLAALGAWWLSGAALRPVERMRADAADFGERDPVGRITVPGAAELAGLARTFNRLLDRLTRSLARQRDLIADAGHELRNPLAVLRAELELADLPGRTPDDVADSLSHARRELERLSKVADDLLFLARADGAGPLIHIVRTDVAAVVSEAARAQRARCEAAGVRLELAGPKTLTAPADPAALRRAVDNVTVNAIVASPPGGTVTVTVSPGDPITIEVVDEGPGFPADFLADAFGRFTRPAGARTGGGGGAGLGLAIVAEILEAHGGRAVAVNRPAGGAVVTLCLPARPARA